MFNSIHAFFRRRKALKKARNRKKNKTTPKTYPNPPIYDWSENNTDVNHKD